MHARRHQPVVSAVLNLAPKQQYVLWCLVAMGQAHVLTVPEQGVYVHLPHCN